MMTRTHDLLDNRVFNCNVSVTSCAVFTLAENHIKGREAITHPGHSMASQRPRRNLRRPRPPYTAPATR